MTRSSKLALVTLVAGLFSLVSVASVSADAPCIGFGQEHCEEMMAAKDASLFQAALAPTLGHVLAVNGMGQEHFETLPTEPVIVFIVAPHLPGYAQEQ